MKGRERDEGSGPKQGANLAAPSLEHHAADMRTKALLRRRREQQDKKEKEQFEDDGRYVVYALAGVFRDSQDMMESMPTRFQGAMKKLYRVVQGDGASGHQHALGGRERRALLDEVFPIFEPFALANAHFEGADDSLPTEMTNLRAQVVAAEATDRVDNAVLIGDGKQKKAVEIPDDTHPREQAAVLGMTVPKLVETITKTVARAHALGKAAGVSEELLEQLETAEHLLSLGASFLALDDKEFQAEINHIKGTMNGVATYSELVKHILEIGSNSIALTCKASALLMKAVGDHAMAEVCEHTGTAVSATLGKVVGAVEIVHGFAVLLDKNASTDDRIGGGVEVASGIATIGAGSSLAALPIMGPYALIKGAEYLLSNAVLGWETDLVRGAFTGLQQNAILQGRAMEHLAAAQLLQQQEQDPERRAALAAEEKSRAEQLKGLLLSSLADTEHRDHGSDIYAPGNLQIISDAFAGPRSRAASARSEDEIIALAQEVTRQTVWCFQRGPAIIQATATHQDIVAVDSIEQKIEKDAKKEE